MPATKRCTEYVELEGGIKVIRRPDGSWVIIRDGQRQTVQPNASATFVSGAWTCDDCGAPVGEVDCSACRGNGQEEGYALGAPPCGKCDGSGKVVTYAGRKAE